jgi:hypothetical protein
MRIFIRPRNSDSYDRVVGRAIEVLQDAQIPSAQARETIHSRPGVLIDPADLPEVVAILGRAGLRVAMN